MPQVAFHFELHVEGIGGGRRRGRRGEGVAGDVGFSRRGRGGSGSFPPAELLVHALIGKVRDVRHHAGDGQADMRAAAAGVVAVMPLGVLHDGLPPHLVEGDGLRAFPRRRGQRNQRRTNAGYSMPHCSTCIPPIEPPTTA